MVQLEHFKTFDPLRTIKSFSVQVKLNLIIQLLFALQNSSRPDDVDPILDKVQSLIVTEKMALKSKQIKFRS